MSISAGLAMIISFAVLLLIGVPICYTIGITGAIGLVGFLNMPGTLVIQRFFNGVDSFPMMAIPFYLLGGLLMERGGVSRRILNVFSMLFGALKGGLAIICSVASAFFGAISGSSPATVAAIGGIMVPRMVEDGYDKGFACACAASTGYLGAVIPPSIMMVTYALASGVSIGDLFRAGIWPGIVLCLAFCIYAYLIGAKKNWVSPQLEKFQFKKFIKVFVDALPAMLMPVIVLGGIYGGVFTPTEAGNIAVIYGLIVGLFVYKELKLKELPAIMRTTAINAARILFTVGAANAFGQAMTRHGFTLSMANAIIGLSSNKGLFLLLANVLFLILGCFMETNSAIILVTPILLPVLQQFGIDPVFFGIIIVINCCIGQITPPVGGNLYIAVTTIDEKARTIYNKYLVAYIAISIACLLLFTYFPGFTMLFA